jgi:hypothetical protein
VPLLRLAKAWQMSELVADALALCTSILVGKSHDNITRVTGLDTLRPQSSRLAFT